MSAARQSGVKPDHHSESPANTGRTSGVLTGCELATGPLCGAKLRNGRGTCRKQAGWGTDHGPTGGAGGYGRCRLHGGNTRDQRKRAAAEEARAEAVKMVMGSPIPTTPEDALQLCIDVTRGEVAYCDRRIGELTDGNAAVPLASDRVHEELDQSGDVHELQDRTVQSTAELHVWINTRIGAVERLARFSKMALDAGVAERRIRIGERQAEVLAGVILAVVGALELTDVQRAKVPGLLEQHVGRLDEAAIEGTLA